MKNPKIAVAVFCTLDGDLYWEDLHTHEEIELIRKGSHPRILSDEKVIIIHGDLTAESHT